MKWTRQEQECKGNYWFAGACYLTASVDADIPKDEIAEILTDLWRFVQQEQGIDYLQVYVREDGTKLWVIDQVPRNELHEHDPSHNHYTILFPHEYGHFLHGTRPENYVAFGNGGCGGDRGERRNDLGYPEKRQSVLAHVHRVGIGVGAMKTGLARYILASFFRNKNCNTLVKKLLIMATLVNDLPLCRLCQKRLANQTGSHIFNSALIKGAVNAKDETKREKEISHTIRPGVGVETYFGRELSMSKVEESLGREMSEQEIEANVNPYTVDHLVCTECEKRIERVENYFMSNVYDKLEKGRFPTTGAAPDLSIAKCDGVDEKLVRLYFYSLAWRAAETKFGNCNFDESDKEFLRKVLDENLDLDIKIVAKNAEANKDEICKLPLIIKYLITTGDSSENFIYTGRSKRPYFFLLNDISFQLFFNEKWVKSHNEFFWGLFKFQKVKGFVNLGSDKPLMVGVVSERFRKEVVLYNVTRCLADIEVKSIVKDFSEVHQKCFGDKPTRKDLAELFKEYMDDNIPMGTRYSIERKSNTFARKIIEIAKRKGFPVEE